MASSIIKKLIDGGTKDSWVYVRILNYVICAQQFNLTPSAAKTPTSRTVTLPFTVATSGGTPICYPIVTLMGSKPEIDTCIVSGSRDTATTVDLYIYASNTTTRSVACLVFGRLA